MDKIRPITEIFPFENQLRFFSLPKVRLIGKALRYTNETQVTPIPLFWNEYFAKYQAIVATLPQVVQTTCAWFGEYDPSTKEYTYFVCSICPADTPVPAELDYWDIPPMLLAHGTISEAPPEAHNIERFAKEVDCRGFTQGCVCCEFYPYDAKASDVCCALFSVKPKRGIRH